MTRIAAYQHGIYPRSEALVAATRDLERSRTTPEAVEDRVRQDVSDFVEVQRAAGLDGFSDGLLRWQDIFRPLVASGGGLVAGPLVRWFDNNAFFRAPVTNGGLSAPSLGATVVDLELLPRPRVATLPSPFLFSRVAAAEGDRNLLMQDLAASVLRPLARELAEQGFEIIHLQEPWLASRGANDGDWAALESALSGFRDGWEAEVVLHLPYGDAAPWADRLRALPVDAIGIDFVETDLDGLGDDWPVGVLVGCIDGRTSLVESPEAIAEFVQRVLDRLRPPVLYVSSATDLELLPRDLARQKVSILGQCAAMLKREAVA